MKSLRALSFRKHSTHRRTERGFTLTELGVGLFVSAIVVGTVAWSATSLMTNYNARRDVRNIAGILDMARAKALRSHHFFAALITRYPGNKSDKHGRILLKEGDSSNMAQAFDDVTKLPTRVSYVLREQNAKSAITRLFLNGKELKATEQLEIFFSPSGRVCTSDSPYTLRPSACLPATFLICLRVDLDRATKGFGLPAKGIHILGSGQIRIEPKEPLCNQGTTP
ncbi:MAG: hypothetical protein AAGJ35_02725 [Myxococcota bacterium]